MTILNRQSINILNLFGAGIVSLLFFVCLIPPKAYGQAALQPSTSSLQPQTGQAQAPTSNLNQTGPVQSNTGGQSFLNQSGLQPLGVVSDPNQSTPDAIATPGQTLKTDITKEEDASILPYIAAGSLIIVVLGVVALWRSPRKIPEETQSVRGESFEENVIAPEPVKRIKKAKKSRRKRRKANQR